MKSNDQRLTLPSSHPDHWQTTYKSTPHAHLQQLYRRYGHHSTANTYLRTPSVAATLTLFNGIRTSGPSGDVPTCICSGSGEDDVREITRYNDMTNQIVRPRPAADGTSKASSNAGDRYALPHDPATQMIQLHLLNPTSGIRTRMTIRASGTESMIKVYVESFCEPLGDENGDWDKIGDDVQREAKEVVEVVKRTWFSSLLRRPAFR